MWQYLIPAATSLIGGLIGSSDKEKARQAEQANFERQLAFQREQYGSQQEQIAAQNAFQREQYEYNKAQAAALQGINLAQVKRQEEMAYEFARSGVQWKVADAVRAGLHPLAAMGASTASGPSFAMLGGGNISSGSVGAGSVGGVSAPNIASHSPMGAALAGMGQDLSRAAMASAGQETREAMFNETVKALQIQNMTLKNDMLASQLQRLKQGAGPPGPSIGNAEESPSKDKVTERGRNIIGGREIRGHPGYSQTQGMTDEYGEGVADWVYGPAKAFFDWMYHTSGAGSVPEYREMNERAKSWQRGYTPLGRR